MSNCANYFPILYYTNNTLTRINGNKTIYPGKYCLLPLFSTTPKIALAISFGDIYVNGLSGAKVERMVLNSNYDLGLPDGCFLVAARSGYNYTPEEVEDINKI